LIFLKFGWAYGVVIWGMAGCLGSAIPQSNAQVVGDRTLPTPTRVTPQGNRIEITEGTRAGSNLFHSFERFSVPENSSVVFNNDAAVGNIFSRVTGRSASRIDGEMRANGSANLFLINPNGIVFGANASLNIGGSFVGSTADRLTFANGSEYSAVNPEVDPVLTVSVPVGLQFGNGLETRSGQIQIQGNGHNLVLNSPADPSVNRSDRPVGLQVNSGRTLALIGNSLALQGGNLTAADGRIELGSVALGQVNLEPIALGWRLDYSEVSALGEISLTQAASLEASGDRGGAIRVQGRNVRIADASAMLADTLGSGTGGTLMVRASGRLRLTGFTTSPSGAFVSRLSTDVGVGATGNGGNLRVVTPTLQIDNGGQISSGTFGAGDGGNLQLRTETIQISGGSLVGPSGLFVPVAANASGNGGRLILNTNLLQLDDRAQIAASTFGEGNAGRLDLRANLVELRGGSDILAIVELGATGNGDRLNLIADRVRLMDGSQISTLTAGAGDAGDVNISAEEIELVGSTRQFASGFLASVEPQSTGSGGSIRVAAERLQIRDGGEISTATFGAGRAGNLVVNAADIEVNGGSSAGPSALLAASRGGGDGGRLTLNADRLRVAAGGQIVTSTSGEGAAGNLTIASRSVELVGGNQFARSGLLSSAIEGTGAGGNLRVDADRLVIEDGATISVSNFPTGGNFRPGRGGVGDLTLNIDQIVLDNQSLLTADSAAGDRGNVRLQSDNVALLGGSAITTNAQGNARGGNINLNTDFLTAFGNSDITANAASNFGGQVTIESDAVLGTQIRSQLTSESDITAFSELGAQFSGTVQLDAPVIDPVRGLVELPEVPIDVSNQIAAACDETEGSEFIVTGRGGLPETPVQILRGSTFWEDLRSPELTDRGTEVEREENLSQNSEGNEIVEAQGWKVNEEGKILLVAQASPPIAASFPIGCAVGSASNP
jgi:filamentous hemagglutinin family protein